MCNLNKYRKIRTDDEYQKIIDLKLEELKEQISNEIPKASEIPIFRNCEFDLDKLNENMNQIINQISKKEVGENSEKLKSSLSFFLMNSYASYLAPAINFNLYIELLIQNNINRMNGVEDSLIESSLYTVHVQNIFISIKCMLDRLVPILSYYYKGFSFTSTFGRIVEGKKTKGLMSVVEQGKDEDELLNFIYHEYKAWVKNIVKPRDYIIHYNDMTLENHYTFDKREFPKHYDGRGLINWNKTTPIGDFHYYKSLREDVARLYSLLDEIFEYLFRMPITYSKQHFKEKEI